ncbi:hypothetical protein Y1Q_0007429 [Alligator mississippiensis]|uniref:Uncharacterized protein n=1 Tax=Alligator mississippiensis TaxID=8496 RepID=A0A151P835_ALLMI|nr:hypothetical protein Y1Q_0007429 [Alligator mississippiensis]
MHNLREESSAVLCSTEEESGSATKLGPGLGVSLGQLEQELLRVTTGGEESTTQPTCVEARKWHSDSPLFVLHQSMAVIFNACNKLP